MEIWKDIKGFGDKYQISNYGRVKSFKLGYGKIMKEVPNRYGYVTIKLVYFEQKKRFSIHRLVATYFLENPLNKKFVNHIDGNKSNNNLSNLEWCTNSENMIHADKIGLRKMPKGHKNSMAKLTESQVREIKFNRIGLYQTEIAKEFKIARQTVSKILNGKSWNHIF
jgi:hypothetical protein